MWTQIGNFLWHISPPLVTVVAGGLIVQRFWVKRANESAVIEYLEKELTALVEMSLEYWSLDSSLPKKAETERQARVLEQRIVGAVKNLSSALRRYSQRYCGTSEFQYPMLEVSDACTGGTFQTQRRTPDSSRYLMIVNAVHAVRWQLFDRRL